jgi:hypothetical protein
MLRPRLWAKPRDGSEVRVIVGKGPLVGPVGSQEQEEAPVLLGRKVHRFHDVVADVPGHPQVVFGCAHSVFLVFSEATREADRLTDFDVQRDHDHDRP